MKVITKQSKNRGVLIAMGCLAAFCATEIGAMRISSEGLEHGKNYVMQQMQGMRIIAEKVSTLQPGEFFIYQKGTTDGIVVTFDVLQECPLLKKTISNDGMIAIPFDFPIDIMTPTFTILKELVVCKAHEKKAKNDQQLRKMQREFREKIAKYLSSFDLSQVISI